MNRDDDIATKAILLQEHQTQLKARLVTKFFNRGAFLLLLFFIIAIKELSKPYIIYPLLGAALLLGLIWFFEILTIEFRIKKISRSLAIKEEGRFEGGWEDAYIRYEYVIASRMLFRAVKTIELAEPILWVFIIIYIIFPLPENIFA
ncbi:MAG: hypothetical protein Q8L68_02040 [Methylococcales bacterium]|nr:hypothetical protein [Methylococcales bacterium]